ncbi:PilP protein [Neisseria weaveri]|nr:pilus assembly protein PilP [Neisseria weaveri]SAY51235.1 PilP protein [Neisseria weaveri]
MIKKILILTGLTLLSACSSEHEDLQEWMQNTQKQARANIKPFEAPSVKPMPPYIPPNQNGLNAFDPKRLNMIHKGANAPNLNRPKEVLENFSLENLKYVGLLENGKQTSGFIEAENHIYTVAEGNYIGQNFGLIKSITADKILLREVVEDSQGNWVFREAELLLSSGETNQDKTTPTGNK